MWDILALVTSGHSPVTSHYWLRLKDSADKHLKLTEDFFFLLRHKNTSQAVLLQTERKKKGMYLLPRKINSAAFKIGVILGKTAK